MFGGSVDGAPAVWTSHDGISWTGAKPELGRVFEPDPLLTWTRLIVPTGTPDGFAFAVDYHTVASTTDGIRWSLHDVKGGGQLPALLHNVWKDLIGEYADGYVTRWRGGVMTSPDGIHWTFATTDLPPVKDMSATTKAAIGPQGIIVWERRWAWGGKQPRSTAWIWLAP